MKISIKGHVGKQEILEKIAAALNSMEDMGADCFNGVNFYFNVIKDSTVVEIHSEQELSWIDAVTLKSSSLHDKDQRKPSSEFNLGLTLAFDEHWQLVNKATKEQEDKERRQRAREERRAEKSRIFWALEKQRALEKECKKAAMLEALGEEMVKTEKPSKLIKSSGWISSAAGVQNYTDLSLPLPVFRVTTRDHGKGEVVFLYSESGAKVFETTRT